MPLNLAIWRKYIEGNLFKDNEFINYARIADDNVQNGKIVVLPQAGSKPTVVKNRTNLPATVNKRVDTDIVYVIDEFTTEPTVIPNAENYELSYSKMDSVLGEHIEALREAASDNLLYEWVREFAYAGAGTTAAAAVIRTTGNSVLSHLDGTTGNRKLFIKEDLKAMQKLFNKQKVSKNERYALLSTEMHSQLLDDPDLKVRDGAFGGEISIKEGKIEKLYGFIILERSSTLSYTTAGVVKAPEAVAVSSDCDSVICWQKNCVERAIGEIKLFQDPDNPLYYGDIYSALVRMGGRKARANAEGIGAIVQAPAV